MEANEIWRNQSDQSLAPLLLTAWLPPSSRSGGDKVWGTRSLSTASDPSGAVLQRVKGTWGNQSETKMQSWWNGEIAVPWGRLGTPGYDLVESGLGLLRWAELDTRGGL